MTGRDAVYVVAAVAMTGMIVFLPYVLAPPLARKLVVLNNNRLE